MKTILVVDDEFGLADSLSALLGDEGYRVFIAVNGRQGFERLAEAKPDLVIVDYMMPVLDGPGMIAAMRADASYAKMPVIMMSAVAEAMVRDGARDFSAFIRKPFDARVLLGMVQKLIGPAQ